MFKKAKVPDTSAMDLEREHFLLTERIGYVLNNPLSSLMTNMALGLVLCFLMGSIFDKGKLLVWILCLLAVAMFRVLIARIYSRHRTHETYSVRFWYRLYFAGTELSALVWSAAPIFFFPTQSPNSQLYLVAILAGLVHGAGQNQAPFRLVHLIYTITIMVPLILRFFLMGSFYYGTFAFALIFLITGIMISTRKMHRYLIDSLILRYEISQMAHIDALTGLANRRHFDMFIHQEWNRAQRQGLPIAMLMIDVDFFKMYNDLYGHQRGDQCLKQIAEAIGTAVHRQTDLIARYGGEEFAVILPDTPLPGALKIAEEMRQAVGTLFIEHHKSPAAHFVTISIGLAVMTPGRNNVPKELIAASDEALYAAKNSGRNRVSVYLEHMQENS
jgi:diguanylate cyclase (GGDEF)-like protein